MLKEQVSRVGTRGGLSGLGWFLSQVVEEPFDSGIDLGNYRYIIVILGHVFGLLDFIFS